MKNKVAVIVSLLFSSCFFIACNEPVTEINLNVGTFSKDSLCVGNGLPGGIKELYKPVQFSDNKRIGVFSGKIYQIDLDPAKNFVSVSDSNSGTILKWREKLLGNKDTYDAIAKKYEKIFAAINITSLCSSSKINTNSVQRTKNFEKLKQEYHNAIVVFSRDSKDSAWNGYKVYKNIDVLKNSLLASSNGAYLVLIGTTNNTDSGKTLRPNGSSGTGKKRSAVTLNAHDRPISSHITKANLEEYLQRLAEHNISEDEKSNIENGIVSLFSSPDAEVILVNGSQATPTGITIESYVQSVSITHRSVSIVDIKPRYGKITEIYVSEK